MYVNFSLGIIHQSTVIRIGRTLSFNHYWVDIGKDYSDIFTRNSILNLCGRTKLTHTFIQFSSKTGPMSSDAQNKGKQENK